MSLLKNILKPFVEFNQEEENEDTLKESELQQKNLGKEKVTNDNVVSADNAVDTASFKTSQTTATKKSGALNDYHRYFENLLEEANNNNPIFKGTDFKEFIDSKVDVEAIADEGTRYKTAFNVLRRTGFTKERLVTTGQEYIKLIDQDLKGFADAYKQQYTADVELKEQLLQKKAEELQLLNDKISALNQEMKQLSQQIVQNKEKLDTNKNAFINAGEEKKEEIQLELQKIDQYF
ncbi:hypothetical protein [Segetibacter koreensis]|uniref:hypothetical protein n=1 Tax=Segetibacter koreensis TaxID=398037 RepID=UPI00036F4DC5|nr:hypothetical protein [Segetibacter koreensis]